MTMETTWGYANYVLVSFALKSIAVLLVLIICTRDRNDVKARVLSDTDEDEIKRNDRLNDATWTLVPRPTPPNLNAFIESL